MNAFGKKYSSYYDMIYFDKDYEGECDYLEELFRKHFDGKVRHILDVACGTGGHAIPLARKGYYVHAADASEHMLSLARSKAISCGLGDKVIFELGDMRRLRTEQEFDACICMFAAIDYLLDYDDVSLALRNIYDQLRDRGILIFDFWNGLAVLTVLPSERVKITEKGKTRLIRLAKPALDPIRNINSTEYVLILIEDGLVKDEVKEMHRVRYFFPEEIRYFLSVNGFELLSLHPFLRPDAKITVSDWNVTAVARRV
jgi:SAM-dependent methyltransferase